MRAIEISPDDLPGIVDARGSSSKKGIRQGVADRCRGAAAVEVALVAPRPDDLPQIVDVVEDG